MSAWNITGELLPPDGLQKAHQDPGGPVLLLFLFGKDALLNLR